jgi:carbonic anhydrase
VDALARASLLYAVLHLEAPLVVVLGHESCGAVTAALAPEEKNHGAPGDIKALIQNIRKGACRVVFGNVVGSSTASYMVIS